MTIYMWHGIVPEARLSECLGQIRAVVIPIYRTAEGLTDVFVWQRVCVSYVDIRIVSLWHSPGALQKFCAEELSTEAIKKIDQTVIQVGTTEFQSVGLLKQQVDEHTNASEATLDPS